MTPAERVDWFNSIVDVGERVAFRTASKPYGCPQVLRTQTPAQIINGAPVIRLEGKDDFISLDRVFKLPPVTKEMLEELRRLTQNVQLSLNRAYLEEKFKEDNP